MQPSTDPSQCHRTDPGGAQPSQDAAEEVLRLQQEVDGLRRALLSRSMVDMALGMVMATEACSLEQAWQVLEASSQRANAVLRTAAQHIVDGHERPHPPLQIPVVPLSSLWAASQGDTHP
ncbi:ANTAR domain-containing protein [Streptomyces sp. NPDC002932]|uniref:ANTAR domain-containing protein n=1 Tax=Streptomyces sp. NPDC002932 TaxID=3364672 RepID=UPI00369C9596